MITIMIELQNNIKQFLDEFQLSAKSLIVTPLQLCSVLLLSQLPDQECAHESTPKGFLDHYSLISSSKKIFYIDHIYIHNKK